jgi:hypothetical protein
MIMMMAMLMLMVKLCYDKRMSKKEIIDYKC